MPQPKAVLLLTVSALCLSLLPYPCSSTLAAASDGGKPLVTAVTKDPATSFYTSPLLKGGRRLVVDLSGPLIWSTCHATHPTFDCHHRECAHAHDYHPPSCPHSGYGVPDEEDRFRCKCTAHPHNPFAGRSGRGDLSRATLSANATDGKNPLYPVSFSAVAACAPGSLLAKLPAGAVGVAGLSGSSKVALPAQVARAEKVPKKFLLCLPKRGDGVAMFGGGPFFLSAPSDLGDLTAALTYTSLVSRKGNPAYYLPVKALAVGTAQLRLPGHALADGGVALGTRSPYTLLRRDVYRPLVDAFDRGLGRDDAKVPAVAPFELCYDSNKLGPTRIGFLVPDIVLLLEGGKNWTITGSNSMVEVDSFRKACFGFVEMKEEHEKGAGYGGTAAPAVVIGGAQMEDNVLQFDLEKNQLGFAKVRFFTGCNNFNFTRAGH